MKFLHCTALALAASLAACESPRTNVAKQDAQGNYITTSDYKSMQRADFEAAMKAGLNDFDVRVTQLRARANELGGESLSDFSECNEDLQNMRTKFANELEKSQVALVGEWPEQRSTTLEVYRELRECLGDSYDEVLDN